MKKSLFRGSLFAPSLLVILFALVLVYWNGCGQEPQTVTSPTEEVKDINKVMEIQDRHTDALLQVRTLTKTSEGKQEIRGVIGTATTVLPDGRYAVKILTNKIAGMGKRLPEMLDGVPVVVEEVGEIRALDFTGETFDPVLSGVSGGNMNLDQGFCSSGTIGGVVTDGFQKFFLSNNHVFARVNSASIGEDIGHPGRADFEGCDLSQVNHVADLSAFKKIEFISALNPFADNRIDAAIAKIRPGIDFNTATACDYTPTAAPVTAFVGQQVKKCGRTSCLTTGEVTAINVTVVVNYTPFGGFASFSGQIQTTNMLSGGDSGSLLVDSDNNPVGLGFAGSETSSIHNPIGEVLAEFGVTFAQ